MNAKQVTWKQHYVQRDYLKGWTNNNDSKGYVFAKYKGIIKERKLTSILFEKDFYKVEYLNNDELEFVYQLLWSIQMYEQRKININKAQAESLFRIASVLGCNIEDLLEK